MTSLRALASYSYAFLWGIPGMLALAEGWRLSKADTGGNWLAGPGGYITLVGLALLGFACNEIIAAARRAGPSHGTDGAERASGPLTTTRVRLSILFMALYVLVTPWLGFILATGVYLVASLRLLGCSKKATVATTGAVCVLIYVVLPLLGISVPRGPFQF